MSTTSGSRGGDAAKCIGDEEGGSTTARALLSLGGAGPGKSMVAHRKGSRIFSQGDRCDAAFYIQQGIVQVTIISESGKEATVALLNPTAFVGEECVSTVQPARSVTATALTDCVLLRIDKTEMTRALREEPAVSQFFMAYLLGRSSRIQADLVDQHFSSVERRLARMLLLLANAGPRDVTDGPMPKLSQETLAAMIGTTRSRVNFCLNNFRKSGFIEYDEHMRIKQAALQEFLNAPPS